MCECVITLLPFVLRLYRFSLQRLTNAFYPHYCPSGSGSQCESAMLFWLITTPNYPFASTTSPTLIFPAVAIASTARLAAPLLPDGSSNFFSVSAPFEACRGSPSRFKRYAANSDGSFRFTEKVKYRCSPGIGEEDVIQDLCRHGSTSTTPALHRCFRS